MNDTTKATTADAGSSRLYAGYERWKGWNAPFAFSTEEAIYFSGEMRGIELAGRSLLEIGFGAGGFLAWARSKGADVAGTEINPTSLAAAKAACVELLDPTIEKIAQLHASRFDVIVAFDVFEHFSLEEVVAYLAAARTILKPGGHLLMRFPNAQSPFGLAPQHGDPTHRSALSRSVFEQLCQDTPFEFVRYAPSFRVRGPTLARRIVRGTRALARDFIAHVFNFVYAADIPWDPVVVLVLRKPR